jgi:hypothetical protein
LETVGPNAGIVAAVCQSCISVLYSLFSIHVFYLEVGTNRLTSFIGSICTDDLIKFGVVKPLIVHFNTLKEKGEGLTGSFSGIKSLSRPFLILEFTS